MRRDLASAAAGVASTLAPMRSLERPRSLVELVEAVRTLPYGRPTERSVAGMLREGCGTCSTKHLFLAQAIGQHFPDRAPRIMHRVYRLQRAQAQALFGAHVAATIPADGLVDVHRYLTVATPAGTLVIDATFPGAPWDGASSMPLACGPGQDEPAGPDPDADKRRLEAEHCDPAVRELFIAALAAPDSL